MESTLHVKEEESGAREGKKSSGRFWSGVNVLLCSLIAVVSFRYLLGVGPVPPLIFGNLRKNPWLVVHVAGAATALLVSSLQLIAAIRRRRPAVHRWLGRLYVVACTIGGIAGIPLALGSAAGPVATAGFGLLAIAWLTTTLTGWRAARRQQFVRHRVWMIRSFSLTFAAVTLRIYLAILPFVPVVFIQGYRAISFLCWVPNLVVAELLLRRLWLRPRTPSVNVADVVGAGLEHAAVQVEREERADDARADVR